MCLKAYAQGLNCYSLAMCVTAYCATRSTIKSRSMRLQVPMRCQVLGMQATAANEAAPASETGPAQGSERSVPHLPYLSCAVRPDKRRGAQTHCSKSAIRTRSAAWGGKGGIQPRYESETHCISDHCHGLTVVAVTTKPRPLGQSYRDSRMRMGSGRR